MCKLVSDLNLIKSQKELPLTSAESPSAMDPYQVIGAVYHPHTDSLTRLRPCPSTTTQSHNSLPNQTIFTQDIALNPTYKTWLRLYKPLNPPPNTKLPLVLYIHGGGFVMFSTFDTLTHDFCTCMATELHAVVLSLEYRLTPESRLPAAYEDAVEALLWIQNQALSESENDHILNDIVDFSECYLMGTSAGGNIAYHAALRAFCLDLEPLIIRGCIFDHPCFSGVERSGSEMRLGDDPGLPLVACDLLWELSLPRGCDRDHEYCNPLVEGTNKDKIGMLGRCLVNTHEGDILVDYVREFAKMLEAKGVSVVSRFQEGGYHCREIYEVEEAKALFAAVRLILSSSTPVP